LLPTPETGGILNEKRQLWHLKEDTKSDGILKVCREKKEGLMEW